MSFLTQPWNLTSVLCLFFLFHVPCLSQRKTSERIPGQVEFSCPEEFGYYPHPNDCTQYYVCVFGGAVLESCTGGLMYSHELQTCDWPRNVGCEGLASASFTDDEPSVQVAPQRRPAPPPPPQQRDPPPRIPARQRERDELVTKPLYEEEELGPAEEIESDRQQRVYRGQPPTLGQVARDRDGIAKHANALQTSSGVKQHVPFNYRASVAPQQNQQQVYLQQQSVSPTPSFNFSSAINQFNQQQRPQQQFDTSYYNLYDDDDFYREDDYAQQFQNQNSNRGKTRDQDVQVSQREQQKKLQQQQQQNNVFNSAAQDYNEQYNLQSADQDTRYEQPSKSSVLNSRGRVRGYSTTTTSPDADIIVTSSRGEKTTSSRSRPTLKPSQSIVSKVSTESVDIYKFPPSRPESVYPTPTPDKTAAKCRKDVCLLPDCYCGGKDIPGDLSVEETPQIVLLTFDDSVNDLNKGLYADLFEKGRTNPNGCPISATFYVSHEWTDYSQVQNLYANGHEMASHTVSHSFGEQFSQKKWTREIAGQREILSAYGGVRLEDIRGMRAPFLAVGGNKMFKMLYDSNFTYDSSMPVYENRPPSWPYTLDYKIFHDCMIPPCPTRSYPGVWEVPMVMWQDLNGGRCSMGDACSNPSDADGVYKMLIKNFERHFTTNRAPFGLYYHAAWFTQPHHKEAFINFMDTIVAMPEVWVVTNWQALQWVRDPTPINRLNSFQPFQCDYPERPKKCNNPKVCNLWHKSGVRYMRTCQPCPDVYPWTGLSGIKGSRVDNEIITES